MLKRKTNNKIFFCCETSLWGAREERGISAYWGLVEDVTVQGLDMGKAINGLCLHGHMLGLAIPWYTCLENTIVDHTCMCMVYTGMYKYKVMHNCIYMYIHVNTMYIRVYSLPSMYHVHMCMYISRNVHTRRWRVWYMHMQRHLIWESTWQATVALIVWYCRSNPVTVQGPMIFPIFLIDSKRCK